MIKAVIFDYGGVLSPQGTITNICLWYSKHYYFDKEEFTRTLRKYWNSAKLNTLSSQDFWDNLSGELNIDHQTLRKEMVQLIKPDDQMIGLARKLKKNYTVGLLSNHVEDWLEEHISGNKLRNIFSVIVTSYNTGFAKPDKKIFQEMKNKLQLRFDECLFIDDKEQNVAAARSVGMQGVLFTDYNSLLKELVKEELRF